MVDWPLLVDGEATGDEREVSVMPPARSMVTHPKAHERGWRRWASLAAASLSVTVDMAATAGAAVCSRVLAQ